MTAHSAETDFTGVNVTSNPAHAVFGSRDSRATSDDNSTPLGGRPIRATKPSIATSLRTRARTSNGTASSAPRPCSAAQTAHRVVTSCWNALAAAWIRNGAPTRAATRTCSRVAPTGRAAKRAAMSGWNPAPNSDCICSADTADPATTSSDWRPAPTHRPGTSPLAV